MIELLLSPTFWATLFGVTLLQLALGADNLIIITIIANKLPDAERTKAIRVGLFLAMLFRIALLGMVSFVLTYATAVFWEFDGAPIPGVTLSGAVSGKAVVLGVGGFFLIWKGVKELRLKLKGLEHEMGAQSRFRDVVAVIVGMNLLFSVDSILTVVGMTDVFAVMVGSVVISCEPCTIGCCARVPSGSGGRRRVSESESCVIAASAAEPVRSMST